MYNRRFYALFVISVVCLPGGLLANPPGYQRFELGIEHEGEAIHSSEEQKHGILYWFRPKHLDQATWDAVPDKTFSSFLPPTFKWSDYVGRSELPPLINPALTSDGDAGDTHEIHSLPTADFAQITDGVVPWLRTNIQPNGRLHYHLTMLHDPSWVAQFIAGVEHWSEWATMRMYAQSPTGIENPMLGPIDARLIGTVKTALAHLTKHGSIPYVSVYPSPKFTSVAPRFGI